MRTPVVVHALRELAERIAAAAATLPRVSGFLCRMCAGGMRRRESKVDLAADAASIANLALQVAMSIPAEDEAHDQAFRPVAPALPRTWRRTLATDLGADAMDAVGTIMAPLARHPLS